MAGKANPGEDEQLKNMMQIWIYESSLTKPYNYIFRMDEGTNRQATSGQNADEYKMSVQAEKKKLIKQISILTVVAFIISAGMFFALYNAVEVQWGH